MRPFHCDEALDGTEEHSVGNWSKRHPCYKLANTLPELSMLKGLWKAKFESEKLGCLAEETSKQIIGDTELVLAAYTEIQEQKNSLEQFLNKKGSRVERFEKVSA